MLDSLLGFLQFFLFWIWLEVKVAEKDDEGGVVPRGEFHHPEGEPARLADPEQRVEVVEHVEKELRDLKGMERKGGELLSKYRVTQHVVLKVALTSKQKFNFSIQSLY